jgi:quaternary ammonium compound-resistance protein SugE
MSLPWLHLLLAGLAEIAWAVGLKYTDGFSRPLPTLATVAGMVVSFYFLALAMRQIPLGTAYAVWTGIGAVGTVILGMVLFGESRDVVRLACIALILAGVIGLKWLAGAGRA